MNFKTLLTFIFLSLILVSNASAGFMAVARISKMKGSATSKAGKELEKLKVGDEVSEGMNIFLKGKTDFIEVKFQNGHLVRFTGATIKVETLNPKNTLLKLIKGKIFSIIKPLTQDETFDIKTKRASFAVRGTKFMVEESKKQSYVCVCEGVVATKSSKGEIDVKKDEDLTLAKANGELQATVAAKSMIDMTNAIFNDMGL